VAEILLSTHKKYINAVSYLNKLFTGGEPVGNGNLTKQIFNSAISFGLYRAFMLPANSGMTRQTKVEFLRTLGFTYQDILQMNPVWQELAKRFDPAIGTYSQAIYQAGPSLPRSREEAAQRIIESGLSYRQSSVLVLTSDKPGLNSDNINDVYLRANPNASGSSGVVDRSLVFKAAALLLGHVMPRGTTVELQTTEHQTQLNLQTLQLFGLGATKPGFAGLHPIPPGLNTSWPASQDNPPTRQAPQTRKAKGTEELTWQQILPMLRK
jgi:hypothetical protein